MYAIVFDTVVTFMSVKLLPSPTKFDAVTTPLMFTPPDTVKVCPDGTVAPKETLTGPTGSYASILLT